LVHDPTMCEHPARISAGAAIGQVPVTRPTRDDGMPDWDRHIHFVRFNLTRDDVEGEWKAVKFRPLTDLRKWFE
jgi:hypothetical protein